MENESQHSARLEASAVDAFINFGDECEDAEEGEGDELPFSDLIENLEN